MGGRQTGEKTVDETPRRGRPPKFGRPGHVVSLTLPDDTLQALNRVDPDTGWAIVKLLEREPGARVPPAEEPDVQLAKIAARRFLIVVRRAALTSLPGVNLVPLNDTHAFLALEPGRGMSELELVVIDRLADSGVDERERVALEALRLQLATWRRDRSLKFHSRSIIVVERAGGASGRNEGERGKAGT